MPPPSEPSLELWRSCCRPRPPVRILSSFCISPSNPANAMRVRGRRRQERGGQGESHWSLASPLKEAVSDHNALPPLLCVRRCRWLDCAPPVLQLANVVPSIEHHRLASLATPNPFLMSQAMKTVSGCFAIFAGSQCRGCGEFEERRALPALLSPPMTFAWSHGSVEAEAILVSDHNCTIECAKASLWVKSTRLKCCCCALRSVLGCACLSLHRRCVR